MPFNSLKYFLFLPAVYLVFNLLGERVRWIVLLAASLLFYAALNVPHLLVVLTLLALSTYCFGIWLAQAENVQAKRALFWSGISANVLILVAMKYLPFLTENLKVVSRLLSLQTEMLPVQGFVAIGVSYYVFQAISYLIDIYLEIEKPERHFGYFALYLAFFPKLLQGPIERAGNLMPQLKQKYEFNYDNMRFGMLLFLWGLFKKVVIADRLGLYVDPVYNDVHSFSGLALLLATYAYAFQIYMDFSGYTDMALGSARLFNINLTQNFNSPYLATSVADFWRRWHISFSRWILDYIFKPLQMQWRNWKNWGTAAALVVAFLVSGIWHGTSWGFVIWGGLHGLYLASSVFYKPYQKKLHSSLGVKKTGFLKAWQIWVTFNMVSFAWVFFRANNLPDAIYVISNLFNGAGWFRTDLLLLPGRSEIIILVASLSVLAASKYFFDRCSTSGMEGYLRGKTLLFRWSLYTSLTISIVLFALCTNSNFIYNKF
jgi:alginate O-acetyltransferase complex protein AlgI